jgi:cytochrome c oxidase subunit 2
VSRRPGLWIIGLGAGLSVAWPARALADGVWLPENVSTLGQRIDHLWGVIFWIATVAFVLTEGALLYAIIRFRARPGHRAQHLHESRALELSWWVFPGAVLVFLALYQWSAWADARLRPPDAAESVRIQIRAKQFEWNVRYAGPDDEFATADDVTFTNQVTIPRDRPILIQLRAEDVIHSFFLPNFRVKQDIVPGQTTLIWFDALREGRFEIACSELCGLGHYRMRGQLEVLTPEAFETWLQTTASGGQVPPDWGWKWEEGV